MLLVEEAYRLVRDFPKDERFGLASQMTRAAVSVPSNIAEGYGRGSRKDYVHFLRQALGSLYEFDTQLEIAVSLGFVERSDAPSDHVDGVSRMLNSLIRKLDGKMPATRNPNPETRSNVFNEQ